MTQNNKSRYARLRAAALLSLVAGVVLLFGTTARATQYIESPVMQEQVKLKADQMPTFEGGDLNKFRQWVMSHVRFPQEAQAQGIDGRVIASFEVDATGAVTGIKILQSPDESLSEEIKRVLEKSPRWVPGQEAGKAVSVKFTIPVDFTVLYDGGDPNKGSEPMPETGPNTMNEIKIVAFGEKAPEPKEEESPFLTVEKMPSFQGGDLMTFRSWVAENMKYPQEAVEKKISGRVLVQFVVNEEGQVTEVKALQSPHALLSNEAIRVVNSSPRWEPGVQKGEKVSVRFVLPVDFAL